MASLSSLTRPCFHLHPSPCPSSTTPCLCYALCCPQAKIVVLSMMYISVLLKLLFSPLEVKLFKQYCSDICCLPWGCCLPGTGPRFLQSPKDQSLASTYLCPLLSIMGLLTAGVSWRLQVPVTDTAQHQRWQWSWIQAASQGLLLRAGFWFVCLLLSGFMKTSG